MSLHDILSKWVVAYLTSSTTAYQRRVPNDPARLRAVMRPGDILLVEGGTRISQIIRYLTQSSWSHAAMYIGDALLRWGGPHAEAALEQYGEEAATLLIESDMKQGVIVVPLSKYFGNNIRICRPLGLLPQDRDLVLGEMLRHLGVSYDRRNIFDLARYLMPFHLLPERWRRKPLYLGSSSSREVICSALIAKAFYKVNYPIQPLVKTPEEPGARGNNPFGGRISVRHPSYIMPRDFDLSANFEVLKVHLQGHERFDYRELAWR
jgi:hypothetical protein